MKRILFVSPPLYGHTTPMIALAAELVERGYAVGVVSSATFAERVAQAAAQFILWEAKSESGEEDVFRQMDCLWGRASREPNILKGERWMLKVGVDMYVPMFHSLKLIFQKFQPDLLVADSTAIAAMDAARQLNIPYVIQALFLGNHFAAGSRYPHFATPYSLHMSFGQRCLNWLVPLRMLMHFFPGLIKANRIRRQCQVRTPLNGLSKGRLIIVGSPFGVEIPRPLPPLVQVVGPILSKTIEPVDPDLKAWLDENQDGTPGVVYMSFGTLVTLESWQAKTLIEGLSENGYRVLWALRKDQQSVLPSLPAAFRIESFVSQRAVLSQPAVRAFVSHCGRNSVNESLSAGKPILGIPFFSDQHFNAARVVDLGVGLKLNKQGFSRDEVRSQTAAVLGDSSYTDAARRMSWILEKSRGLERAADLVETVLAAGIRHFLPQTSKATRR